MDIPHVFINYRVQKGENSTFTVEKSARYHLHQAIEANITNDVMWIYYGPTDVTLRAPGMHPV